MSLSRKEFFKKACISCACLCGFGSASLNAGNASSSNSLSEQGEDNLVTDWLTELLLNLYTELDDESAKKILKKVSNVHYNQLNMDEFLNPYIGDLEKFITFIEREWGWKIEYDSEENILIADENKDYCVCPILEYEKDIDTSLICYCSEGFAEKMFSIVSGKAACATVISSIRKGNDRCIYKIAFKS